MYQHLRRLLPFIVALTLLITSMPPPALAQTYALEVYTNPNYGGSLCLSNTPESANIYVTCNDQISSIRLMAGWSVRVYRDQNQGGPSVCFNRSDTDLADNTFEDNSPANDAISSFTLYSQAWCGGAPTPAYPLEVYNDPGYGGAQCYSWQAEIANVYAGCNDQISSVLLRAGWSVRVYRDQSQGGSRGCLTGSDDNLADNSFFDGTPMNDAISSFALYSQGNCANIPPHVPTPSGPANGSQHSSQSVTLSWADTGDPDNWPRTYRDYYVEIRKADNSWSTASGWQTATSWTPTVPSFGTYIWRVQSGDGMLGSGWSSEWSFTVGDGPPDITAPMGNVTSPATGVNIGPSSVRFSADAWDNVGGSGVNRVEFYISYSGNWHLVGTDTSGPYSISWATPGDLRSQQLRFTIHVVDNANNRHIDPGGYRLVNFIESNAGGQIVENWIPESRRAYLNQLSLGSDGWQKCSVTSMAMVLAMNGKIGKDQATMAAKANAMWPNVLINGWAYVYKMRDELRRHNMISDYHGASDAASANNAWAIIKSEINAGRPVIFGSPAGETTSAGHFIVAVGYREVANNRELIAYDPYGKWLGGVSSYDRNSVEPTSDKGKWVFYDYSGKMNRPHWLITARLPGNAQSHVLADTSLTPPDEMSTEAPNIVTFEGVPTRGLSTYYLPFIER